MKSTSMMLGAVVSSLVLAASARAQTTLITFDLGLPGSLANNQAPTGVSFQPGAFLPDLDSFGDPIPGSERWQIDVLAPPVVVEDPNTYGYGDAPSPTLALEGLWSPTLILFSSPADLSSFSVTLDQSTFGSLAPLTIDFYSSTPTSDTLLSSVSVDQTVPGLVVNAGPLSGVNKIVLPAGAFYDNVSYTVVPEPTALALAGLGGLALLTRRVRRS